MELLERERALDELTAWLAVAARGAGCTVLVGGEAGIGKTTLLREFCGPRHPTRVLWGACDHLFTPRPLGPLHDIARQSDGALSAALGGAANRDRIFTAALDELEGTPTLLVLEDLHWADEATLDLVTFLGRRIGRTRSMMVVSYRDDEVDARHPLRIVVGDLPRGNVHRLSLAPLSEAAVSQLACAAGRRADGLHGITGGNPLLLTEVLAAGGGAEAVPATVRDAVLGRTARLAPAARAVAELVCVVPGRVESWLLDRAAAPDHEAVEGCLRIGMILSDDGAIGFRHELVRRALEDSLPAIRRQALHARVLAALVTREGISAARLAHHASGANDGDSVRRYATLAATEAADVGAHRQAVDHLDILVQHAEELPAAERARLLERLSYECFLTGRYARASEARRGALEIWRALGEHRQRGEALSLLSRLAWFEGRRADAYAYSAEALEVLESLPAGPALARALCHRADLDMESHENVSAIDHADRALELAQRFADGRLLSDSLSVRGTARLVLGDPAGWEDLERCLELALAGRFHEQVASAYTDLAAMAVSRRRYEAADRHLTAGLQYCEARDLDFLHHYLIGYRARMKFERGDWLGASEDAEEVLRHGHVTAITRIPVLRTLGHLRIRRGDPDAESPLAEAVALAGPEPTLQGFGSLAVVRAEAAWLAGDRTGVVQAVMPAYERVARKRDPRMKGELAAWLFRVQALDGMPDDVAEPYALEIAGRWREAAGAWEALGCPYERALTFGLHGGEAQQREALSIFETLGAAPAAEELRRRMRASGLRGVPRGLRASTQEHPFGLTRREAQILGLMRDGLRNAGIAQRLFLSTRTVDHHVSSILAKLRVTSRAAAIEIARQQPESAA